MLVESLCKTQVIKTVISSIDYVHIASKLNSIREKEPNNSQSNKKNVNFHPTDFPAQQTVFF